MIGALGRVLDGLERDLRPQAMVELPRHGIAPGAPCLLGGHTPGSAYTTFNPCSAYTASEATPMPRSDIFDLNENDGTHLHKGRRQDQKRCYDLHCLHSHPCGDLCEGL